MALAIGAFAFVSCDKEKDDLTEQNGKAQERVDPSTVLTLPQQQAKFVQAAGNLGQQMEFTDMAQAIGFILKQFKYDVEWEDAIDAACEQDASLKEKLNAVKRMLKLSDNVSVDFDNLYFEADIAFKDSVITDSSEYKYYKSWYEESELTKEILADLDTLLLFDTISVPVLLNINHDADQFKLTLHATDGKTISFCLRGHSDIESRIAITDTKRDETHTVALPDSLNISLCLDDDTLVCLNVGYATNFKVDLKGAVNDNDKLKISSLKFTGNELSLDADASIDKYSLKTKANYDDENGLNFGFAAGISNTEAVTGNIHLRGKFDNSLDWAETSNILVWASNVEYFQGLDCNVNIFSDEIKLHASLENPLLNGSVLQLFALLATASETTKIPADTTMVRLVNEFNNIFKGEIYFKGYAEPQARVKLVYDPAPLTKAPINISEIGKTIGSNFDRFGLKIGVETYDQDGVKVFVSFVEYFKEDDYKPIWEQLKQNFEYAFGPVLSTIKNKQVGKKIVVIK